MIILDERNFVAKHLEDKGFDLFDFYENHQKLILSELVELPLKRRSEILLVDTQSVLNHPAMEEKFKTLLNTFLCVIFIHEHKNEAALTWVKNQAAFLGKIIGEYSLPMDQLQWTMLSNQLQFFSSLIQEQKDLQTKMVEFSSELDSVLQTAEWEVSRAKKVHEILIPKRSDEIKGVQFINKYAAGDGGGGEFYDLHHVANKVYQILVSSQSYLISSALLGLLDLHKKGFDPAIFVKEAQNEIQIINSSKKKKSNVEVMVLELDLSHLTMTKHGFSNAELYSQKEEIHTLTSESTHQLERGERLIVFSSGFLSNWKKSLAKQDINTFLKGHHHLSSQELLMELFYQLREGNKEEFLSSDGTVVMMEVNRHGIHQI